MTGQQPARHWDGQQWLQWNGTAWVPIAQRDPLTPTPIQQRNNKILLGIILGFVGLVAVFVVVVALLPKTPKEPQDPATAARYSCKLTIPNYLNDPGSADISTTASVTKSGDVWTVAGTLRARNGFNALVERSYTCRTHQPDPEHWQVISVSID